VRKINPIFISKLTKAEVCKIYLSPKKQRLLAKEFGVSENCISQIKLKRTFAWLTDQIDKKLDELIEKLEK